MFKTILASNNEHKLEEFQSLLKNTEVELLSIDALGGSMPSVEETGQTFHANALLKASALSVYVEKGYSILSDDSGLEVDFLGGAPGVYSARYAGDKSTDQENGEKLLEALSGVSEELRTARFRCVLCWIHLDKAVSYFEGICEGRIAQNPQGASGFGYDPIFIPQGYEQTFGQLGETIKSQLSHRARAIRTFRQFLNTSP